MNRKKLGIIAAFLAALGSLAFIVPSDKASLGVPPNYILNGGFERGLYNVKTYADTAQALPVDGTGGSPSHVSISLNTGSPLNGYDSLNISNSGTTSAQGEGVSIPFTISKQDEGHILSIDFSYLIGSGTFQAGSDSQDSDLEVFVYDVTNSQLIEPVSYKLYSNSSNPSYFHGTFQSAYNSTSYRLILHVATSNTSAWALTLDSVTVSSQKAAQGPPVTDWVSFTPTGSWTTNTTYTGSWRRVGDSIEVRARATCSGAPDSSVLTVNLPSGYSIDTGKLTSHSEDLVLGSGIARDSLSGSYNGITAVYQSATSVALFVGGSSVHTGITYLKDQASVSQSVPFTFGASDYVEVQFKAPILGWSSNVQMSSDGGTRLVIAKYTATSSASVPDSATVFNFGTKVEDRTSSVTTGSSWKFTAPDSGSYRVAAVISFTSGSSASRYDISIRKNGIVTDTAFLTPAVSTVNSSVISSIVQLNAGDYIDVVHNETVNGGSYAGTGQSISIEKVSGSQQFAASDTVAARYSGVPTGTIDNTFNNILTFPTKSYDYTGSYSSGTFTCPISGLYEIKAKALITAASMPVGDFIALGAALDGTLYSYNYMRIDSTNTGKTGPFYSDEIQCLAGQAITIRLSTNVTTPAASGNTNECWASFRRVGN